MVKTKSRNLPLYKHFLKYDRAEDVPFNELANKLNVHPNRLRGMIRSAKHNHSITEALNEMGYETPDWFAGSRKRKSPVTHFGAAQPPAASAERRSAADDRWAAPGADTRPISGPVPVPSAERSSALSQRSAPPAYVPVIVSEPMSPILEEAHRNFRETRRRYMREDLEESRRRRAPKKPLTAGELVANYELNRAKEQMERENARQMFLMVNWFHQQKASETRTIREDKESLNELPDRIRAMNGKREETGLGEAVKTLFDLSMPPRPDPDRLPLFLQKLNEAKEEERRDELESLVAIAKIIAEKKSKKNPHLELSKARGKRIEEEFYRTLSDLMDG